MGKEVWEIETGNYRKKGAFLFLTREKPPTAMQEDK